MTRPKITLDDWRDQIQQWVRDGARRDEIQKRLQEQANIRIGASTLSTQLRAWNVRYNRTPIKKTDALRERVAQLFHERPGLKDEETVRMLQEEGFQISGTRALARLRKEAGLYKRVEKVREETVREEVVEALRREFGEDVEMPEGMGTRELAGYLRGKYNVVGRDRVRRIATELNPEWVQRRKQKGQFPRPRFASPRLESRSEAADFNGNISYNVDSAGGAGYTRQAGDAGDGAGHQEDDGEFPELARLAELSKSLDGHSMRNFTTESAASDVSYNDFAPPWLDPSLVHPP